MVILQPDLVSRRRRNLVIVRATGPRQARGSDPARADRRRGGVAVDASADNGITGQRSCARWTGAPAGYLPIAEHGIIGDLSTAALVGSDCTIDWFCPDRFDGPSVFGALLDRDRGGFYRIAPVDPRAANEAAVPFGDQCPGHAVSLPGGRGRGSGFSCPWAVARSG